MPVKRAALVLAGLCLTMWMSATTAEAACNVQPASDASFGAHTSFVIRDVSQQTSTTSAGLVCSGAVLSLLGTGDHIYATITSANGGLLGPGGNLIGYTIYGDSTTAYPIPTGVQFDYASGQLLNLLGLFGGPATALPMFFRTTPGANVVAGTYTDTITINWSWNYCPGVLVLGACVLGRDIGTGQSTFQITVTVNNACAITSTPDVSFGTAPVASSFLPVSNQVGVVCTKNLASYSVGIDWGQHAPGQTRRMSNGTHFLEYDVFKGSSFDVWGTTGGARVMPGAAADGVLPQYFPYTLRIRLPQATPPVGTYQDVLVVDVTF